MRILLIISSGKEQPMTDELNLPEKFRVVEKATKNWPVDRHLFVMPNTIEQLLTALSETREKLDAVAVIGKAQKEVISELQAEIASIMMSHEENETNYNEKIAKLEEENKRLREDLGGYKALIKHHKQHHRKDKVSRET